MKRSIASAAALVVGMSLFASPMLAQPGSGLSDREAGGSAYEKLVAQRASSMVNIKLILKAEGQEQESEIPAVMVEKTGLLLASTIAIGEMQSRFGGVSITPTNIKVLIGEDTLGVDARMIARDSDLALAWFQIDKPAEAGYEALDFGSGVGAEPVAGDSLMVISQLGKFFHRANVVTEGKVTCVTTKPRRLLLPSIALVASDFGVPVFDAQTRPVGFFSAVLPDKEEMEGTPGGLEELMKGIPGLKMIIPASAVVAATKRAKETAAANPPTAEPAPQAPSTPPPSSPSPPR